MTELVQNLIDGLGRGSIYALLALGVAVVFGVMHLLNFAHGELITVSGYATYAAFNSGWSWYVVAPLIVLVSIATSLLIERIAFSRVRGSSEFTQLLTSFGIHFLVSAIFLMYVGARVQTFPEPGWIADTYSIGPLQRGGVRHRRHHRDHRDPGHHRRQIFKRTMFGLSLRAAAADFDAAQVDGRQLRPRHPRRVRPVGSAGRDRGDLLADAGGPHLAQSAGIDPMLSGVLAALIGGLGSLKGAVIGGLALGLAEVMLRTWLPGTAAALTDGVVFTLIALLFIFRPQGLVNVPHAERV